MSLEKLRIVGSLFLALTAWACGEDVKAHDQPVSDSGTPDTGGSTTEDSGADAPPPGDTRPCEGSTLTNGNFMLMHGGLQYSYVVHVPPSYDGTKRTPLLLNWHPYGTTALEQQFYTGTDILSDEQGFIVVYPTSPDKSWNGGTCCFNPDGGIPNHDDVGFARALVAEISRQACVDSKRIYSTGMSNGGFMSHRLACEAADLFAAVVPVASTMGVANCQPARPIAIMHHHGTEDLTIPYQASMFSAEGVGVAEMMGLWGARNGCKKGPDTTFQMGTVTCQTWSQCMAGVLVTLCSSEGSGHCWPGASFCVGGKPFTTDISATRDGWAFLKQFVLP